LEILFAQFLNDTKWPHFSAARGLLPSLICEKEDVLLAHNAHLKSSRAFLHTNDSLFNANCHTW
jgi:hypothetical protein